LSFGSCDLEFICNLVLVFWDFSVFCLLTSVLRLSISAFCLLTSAFCLLTPDTRHPTPLSVLTPETRHPKPQSVLKPNSKLIEDEDEHEDEDEVKSSAQTEDVISRKRRDPQQFDAKICHAVTVDVAFQKSV